MKTSVNFQGHMMMLGMTFMFASVLLCGLFTTIDELILYTITQTLFVLFTMFPVLIFSNCYPTKQVELASVLVPQRMSTLFFKELGIYGVFLVMNSAMFIALVKVVDVITPNVSIYLTLMFLSYAVIILITIMRRFQLNHLIGVLSGVMTVTVLTCLYLMLTFSQPFVGVSILVSLYGVLYISRQELDQLLS